MQRSVCGPGHCKDRRVAQKSAHCSTSMCSTASELLQETNFRSVPATRIQHLRFKKPSDTLEGPIPTTPTTYHELEHAHRNARRVARAFHINEDLVFHFQLMRVANSNMPHPNRKGRRPLNEGGFFPDARLKASLPQS